MKEDFLIAHLSRKAIFFLSLKTILLSRSRGRKSTLNDLYIVKYKLVRVILFREVLNKKWNLGSGACGIYEPYFVN